MRWGFFVRGFDALGSAGSSVDDSHAGFVTALFSFKLLPIAAIFAEPLFIAPLCFSLAFYEPEKQGAEPPGPLAARITG